MTFSMDLTAKLNFEAAATVTARTSLSATMGGKARFDSVTNPSVTSSGIAPVITYKQQPAVAVDISGSVGLEIALKPMLQIGIAHVAYAALSTDAFIRFDAIGKYPPFPALASSYQLPSPVPASLSSIGSCTSPHLVRYGVTASLRNANLEAVIDQNIGSSIDSAFKSFDIMYRFPVVSLLAYYHTHELCAIYDREGKRIRMREAKHQCCTGCLNINMVKLINDNST